MGLGSSYVGFGRITVDAFSSWMLGGTIAGGETLAFGGSGAYLRLDNPGSVAGAVTDFSFGDTIDLAGVDSMSVNYTGDLPSFSGGSFALTLSGGRLGNSVSQRGRRNVTLQCFRANTLIKTSSGERPVQELAVGDKVCVLLGDISASHHLDRPPSCGLRMLPAPPKGLAGARLRLVRLARTAAQRFVAVAGSRGLRQQGVEFPIKHLINGSTIVQGAGALCHLSPHRAVAA